MRSVPVCCVVLARRMPQVQPLAITIPVCGQIHSGTLPKNRMNGRATCPQP